MGQQKRTYNNVKYLLTDGDDVIETTSVRVAQISFSSNCHFVVLLKLREFQGAGPALFWSGCVVTLILCSKSLIKKSEQGNFSFLWCFRREPLVGFTNCRPYFFIDSHFHIFSVLEARCLLQCHLSTLSNIFTFPGKSNGGNNFFVIFRSFSVKRVSKRQWIYRPSEF